MQQDPTVSYALGSPMKAYGMDRGGNRGRRNEMERWELTHNETGEAISLVRFMVAGPQGLGIVQVQTPANRKRGEFEYIIYEDRRTRGVAYVVDNRQEHAVAAKGSSPKADAPPAVPPVPAPPGSAAGEVPPAPPPLVAKAA